MDTPRYPLTAVVGQEHARRALSIALINPRAGGLLISGMRGTAKSVLVRAAAPFTPTGKIMELPLGAAEDMIFGTIDMEAALQKRGALPAARTSAPCARYHPLYG